MLPIALDLACLPIIVVGRGAQAVRRLDLLAQADARRVTIFADAPDDALKAVTAGRLRHRLPSRDDLAGAAVLFVCDLPRAASAALAATARTLNVLVNVEDETALCDFHMPAIVRRGDLVLSISTGGKSPGLARAIKQWLERLLDARWATRIELLARHRRRWRAKGHSAQEIGGLTRRLLGRTGWLPGSDRDAA
jgi:precorrin-2 dehydrogenase/sirohydrochlorin ferrochelatase